MFSAFNAQIDWDFSVILLGVRLDNQPCRSYSGLNWFSFPRKFSGMLNTCLVKSRLRYSYRELKNIRQFWREFFYIFFYSCTEYFCLAEFVATYSWIALSEVRSFRRELFTVIVSSPVSMPLRMIGNDVTPWSHLTSLPVKAGLTISLWYQRDLLRLKTFGSLNEENPKLLKVLELFWDNRQFREIQKQDFTSGENYVSALISTIIRTCLKVFGYIHCVHDMNPYSPWMKIICINFKIITW